MGLLTDVMMSKDKIKKKVEKAILEEMIFQLSEELPKALRDRVRKCDRKLPYCRGRFLVCFFPGFIRSNIFIHLVFW